MANLDERTMTFPVDGIFGVGSLATRLKALEDSGQIGPWHVGHWIDFRHTAIRIQFNTRADGETAEGFIDNWHMAHVPAVSAASDAPVEKG
jgi:hypothetical protein